MDRVPVCSETILWEPCTALRWAICTGFIFDSMRARAVSGSAPEAGGRRPRSKTFSDQLAKQVFSLASPTLTDKVANVLGSAGVVAFTNFLVHELFELISQHHVDIDHIDLHCGTVTRQSARHQRQRQGQKAPAVA
ncbi:hypothetical protein AR275_30235 [Stenotrophomonas maltophilia]|nr:hypothetical protein AR275_30235 [Stenotrophomonas maltophilia]PZS83812.1 hypothetical protein A7X74_07095 [Stenotrophomonas maltophilia]